jgi:hypothetical protein
MTDAGFVVAGWALTGAALAGYLAKLWVRVRRVRQLLPDEEGWPTLASAGDWGRGLQSHRDEPPGEEP